MAGWPDGGMGGQGWRDRHRRTWPCPAARCRAWGTSPAKLGGGEGAVRDARTGPSRPPPTRRTLRAVPRRSPVPVPCSAPAVATASGSTTASAATLATATRAARPPAHGPALRVRLIVRRLLRRHMPTCVRRLPRKLPVWPRIRVRVGASWQPYRLHPERIRPAVSGPYRSVRFPCGSRAFSCSRRAVVRAAPSGVPRCDGAAHTDRVRLARQLGPEYGSYRS